MREYMRIPLWPSVDKRETESKNRVSGWEKECSIEKRKKKVLQTAQWTVCRNRPLIADSNDY